MDNSNNKIPIAIIIGFFMLSVSIFFIGKSQNDKITETNVSEKSVAENVDTTETIKTVDKNDYIRGNPNAPILIVEYSDYDCPFCKEFHGTMKRIMAEFGAEGKVGWVYRQFPIADLHPNSPKISKAALCVGDIGGNDAFWRFSDLIFENRSFDQFTLVTKLPSYAKDAGVNINDYKKCMEKPDMEEAVTNSLKDGIKMGIKGTPHVVIIAGGEAEQIDGSISYVVLKDIINNFLDQLTGRIDINKIEPTSDQ